MRRSPSRSPPPLVAARRAARGACSDDGGPGARRRHHRRRVLAAIADDVIIPSYEALVADLDGLGASLDALCQAPSRGRARRRARDAGATPTWRGRAPAPTGVGPAMERRAMRSIAFRARPDKVEDARSPAPTRSTPTALDDARRRRAAASTRRGRPVRRRQRRRSPPPTAPRRCEYARSATDAGRRTPRRRCSTTGRGRRRLPRHVRRRHGRRPASSRSRPS